MDAIGCGNANKGEETISDMLSSVAKNIKNIDGNMIRSSMMSRKALCFGDQVVHVSPGRKVHFIEQGDIDSTGPCDSVQSDTTEPKQDAGLSMETPFLRNENGDYATSDIPAENKDAHVMEQVNVNMETAGLAKDNGNIDDGPATKDTLDDVRGMGQAFSYASVIKPKAQKGKPNFRALETDNSCKEAELSIPISVVQEINNRFGYTLYGYFLGKRLAFPVVEYYVKNAWAKFGINKVMMNTKGVFFFKFDNQKGLEDVLEAGPWMIRNIPIILKKWTVNTNILKEDLSHVPVWVKLHDVPLAVFSEDGLSLIATKLGKPIMLDSFTSTMCMESWGRCSFARCLIEVRANEMLKESVTMPIPLLDGAGFSIETVRVEYEWKPPRCDICKVFGHTESCLTNVPKSAPNVEKSNDGFQKVGKRRSGNSGGAKGGGKPGFSVGSKVQYVPKEYSNPSYVTTSKSKSKNGGAKVDSNVSKKGKEVIGSVPNNVVNTSNKYGVLSNEFDSGFEETNVNDKVASSSKNQVDVDLDTNKVADPFMDVATESDNEVFDNYDDLTNYLKPTSFKDKGGSSNDFKVQPRKKKL
ncbi:zinc knuckle CX2CX4HX4C [Artemisia annua]|uniref:Zinc knuckle CX2CX4HX4C n=1 Tax=Artemisia annua TaxID=35608 RepID=A0A2U1KJP3_ARTAN|nr:zinc knuckle CX2CX4HX4C [Artemisia annua]